MNINIEGNNNRVAGRDYVEYKPYEICPECEYRALVNNRSICKHCEQEHDEILRQQSIVRRFNRVGIMFMLLGFGLIFLANKAHDYVSPPDSLYTGIIGFIGLLIAAAGVRIYKPK